MPNPINNTYRIPCEYCSVPIISDRLQKHIELRCPRAPDHIKKLRPAPRRRQRFSKSNSLPNVHTQQDYMRGLQKVAYAKYIRAQLDSMSD